MKATVTRAEPTVPPITSVTLTMTKDQADALYHLGNWAVPEAFSGFSDPRRDSLGRAFSARELSEACFGIFLALQASGAREWRW